MPSWHAPLSTSPEAAAAYLEGLHRYLTILPAAGRSFSNAFELDPSFGAGAAALAVAATGVGELDLAQRALAAARESAAAAPDMTRSQITAVDAFLTQPSTRALRTAGQHLRRYPADVLVLALTLNTLHGSGRPRRRQEALELLDRASATGTDHFAVPSLRSVIAADLGLLDEARDDALAGLAANGRSAHAAHGLAHVHYERAEHEQGRTWLTTWTADFDPRASGVHLTWHLALHDLALGDRDALLARYDNRLRPHLTSTLYVDAVDILWRLQLSGADVSQRFSSLQEVVPAVAHVRGSSLSRLQAVVVRRGADDAVLAPGIDPSTARVAQALQAIHVRDLEAAVEHLEAVGGELVTLAASNAQLDLVSQTLTWCYAQLGRQPREDAFLVARLSPGPARATGTFPTPRRRALRTLLGSRASTPPHQR